MNRYYVSEHVEISYEKWPNGCEDEHRTYVVDVWDAATGETVFSVSYSGRYPNETEDAQRRARRDAAAWVAAQPSPFATTEGAK